MATHPRVPVGSRCEIRSCFSAEPLHHGVVIKHGRDSGGIYTRVRLDDGTVNDWHRSYIYPEQANPQS